MRPLPFQKPYPFTHSSSYHIAVATIFTCEFVVTCDHSSAHACAKLLFIQQSCRSPQPWKCRIRSADEELLETNPIANLYTTPTTNLCPRRTTNQVDTAQDFRLHTMVPRKHAQTQIRLRRSKSRHPCDEPDHLDPRSVRLARLPRACKKYPSESSREAKQFAITVK